MALQHCDGLWETAPPMFPFTETIRVRYNECDPQGVVFNANFLLYMDIACTEAWRTILGGSGYTDLAAKHEVDVVVAEANVKYLAPVTFDDEIAVTIESVELGNTSMTWNIVIRRAGKPVSEGRIRNVFISPETWKPVPAPDAVREVITAK